MIFKTTVVLFLKVYIHATSVGNVVKRKVSKYFGDYLHTHTGVSLLGEKENVFETAHLQGNITITPWLITNQVSRHVN